MRAADPPGRALGRRDGRQSPAAGGCYRPRALLHLRDRGAGLRDRRARPARRHRPHARDRRAGGFGISLLVPPIGDRVEAFASRIAPGPARFRGEGFGSGLVVGASLGLVYAPCAGPILAGVITASAAQDFTAGRLAVALSLRDRLGAGALRAAAGRTPAGRPARPDPRPGAVAMGALMICVAVLIATEARHALPDRDRRRPARLPGQPDRRSRGRARRSPPSWPRSARHGGGAEEAGAGELDQGLDLPRWARRPDFTGTQSWFNTDGGEASHGGAARPGRPDRLLDLHLHQLHPHAPLPEGVGRASTATTASRSSASTRRSSRSSATPATSRDAIDQNGIAYPVAQDNELGTWSAYGNQYWPAKYLIDAEGQVRYVHFGEGEYETTERAIRTLLREKGDDELGGGARASAESANPADPHAGDLPRLGARRGLGERPDPRRHPGASEPRRASSAPGAFAYSGSWQITPTAPPRRARPGSTPSSRPRRCSSCSARPARPGACGCCSTASRSRPPRRRGRQRRRRDDHGQRLYRLIDLPEAGRHRLQLRFDPGIEGYAFTFG